MAKKKKPQAPAPVEKPRHEKYATEMEFDEFVTWATAHIWFGIARGDTLRQLVWTVCNQAVMNKVFGPGGFNT